MTAHQPDQKGDPVPLVRSTNQSFQDAKDPYVPTPSPQTTKLLGPLLPCHGRLSLQRGSCTLTGGRNKPLNQETDTTPNRLLLFNIPTN